MRFFYEYRTRDNVPCQGEICAPSKEDAYKILKSKGIRPGKVWDAPGLMNKLLGRGKRWIAIFALAISLVGVAVYLRSVENQVEVANKELDVANQELNDLTVYEERGQIYGSKSVLKAMRHDRFRSVFGDDDVSRYLAAYAIPGIAVDVSRLVPPRSATLVEIRKVVSVLESDMDEEKKLKRMVNGMRREFAQYINDGGTVSGYMQRLDIRQKAECAIYNRVKSRLLQERNHSIWQEENRKLRQKGLPMVEPPEIKSF